MSLSRFTTMLTLRRALELSVATCTIANVVAMPERWKPAEPWPPPDVTIGTPGSPLLTKSVQTPTTTLESASSKLALASSSGPEKPEESESITIEPETSLSWEAKHNETADSKDIGILKQKKPGSGGRILGAAKFTDDYFESDVENDPEKLRWIVVALVGKGVHTQRLRFILDTGGHETWAYSRFLTNRDRARLSQMGINTFHCQRDSAESLDISYSAHGGIWRGVTSLKSRDRFKLPSYRRHGAAGRGAIDIPDLGIGCVSSFALTVEQSWEGILGLAPPRLESNTFITKASQRNNYKRVFTLDFYDNDNHRGWNPSMKKSTWTVGKCTCKSPKDTSYISLKNQPEPFTTTFTTTLAPIATTATGAATTTATVTVETTKPIGKYVFRGINDGEANADSGSTHFSIPEDTIQRWLSTVGGRYDATMGRFWFPCNKAKGGPNYNLPPDLWVEVRSYNGRGATSGPAKNPNHHVRIPGKYLVGRTFRRGTSKNSDKPDRCYPNVRILQPGRKQLYGAPFLLAYKTCFDQTRKIMSFCKKE